MTGKADVQTHLDLRRPALEALVAQWAQPDLGDNIRADIVANYFQGAAVGQVQRVGNSNSIHVAPATLDAKRANVLVVGCHDVSDLSDAARHTKVADLSTNTDGFAVGPGLASRLGPTMAFCEGFHAARTLTVDGPINLSFLSLGEGDSFSKASQSLFLGNLDAIYLTDAVSWSPRHPTMTVGARGRLVVQLRLDAGHASNDFITAGAIRNPLAKMTQILGAIRDERGRIAIPGFYERALAPDADLRASLQAEGLNPNEWSDQLHAASLTSGLSTLERASLWPGASVLSLEASPSDDARMPAQVSATIALYLVPDQRHVEIERAVRAWFIDQVPVDLQPSVKVLASSRPVRSRPDSLPIAAQARAAFQLHGRHPIPVAAGGAAGAGELAFAAGAPVGFAGIAPPSTSWGTHAENMAWSDFDTGVALAAETCLQLRRG